MPSWGGGRIRITYEAATKDLEAGSKRAEASIDGVSDAARRQNVELAGTSASIDRVDDSTKRYSRSNRDAARDTDNLSKKLQDANVRFTAIRNLMGLIKWPALISGAGYAAEGLGELAAGAVATTSALAPLSGALIAYPALLGTFAQSLGVGSLALFGVTGALKEMNNQQIAAGTTAKESAKAQSQAAEQVRSAERALGQAQTTAKRAQTELTAARHAATENLLELKNAAIDAGFGEERAALALENARKQLRRARNHPGEADATELRELELSVEEAHQSLSEAKEGRRKADRERAKGEREGVDKNPGVRQAHRALGEAKLGVAEAAHQVVLAQRAERESMESTSSAATKLENKLASLPAAARKFTHFLFGLKPEVKALQSVAASGLFPGVEGAIKKALPLLPRLKAGISETAHAMGNAAERAGDWVSSKGFGRDFSTIMKGNVGLIGHMTTVGIKLADALRQVMVAGQPLIKWMGESAAHLATWVDEASKAGRQSGALAGWFEKTRAVMETFGSMAKNLATGFWEIGKAAMPLGEEILSALNGQTQKFAEWTQSITGRNSLKQYFAEAKPGIFEFGRLLKDVGKDLLGLSKGSGFFELTHELRTQLLPVIDELLKKTTTAFGPVLVQALVQVGKLLGDLSGAGGPLALFVGDVTKMLGALNWGFRNIPGLKGFVVTLGGIFAVEKALKFTGMVSGLGSPSILPRSCW